MPHSCDRSCSAKTGLGGDESLAGREATGWLAPRFTERLCLLQDELHRTVLLVRRVLVFAEDALDHQPQSRSHTLSLRPIHRDVLAQVFGEFVCNLLERLVGQLADG